MTTTKNGEIKGKLAYIAPEYVYNGYVDQRSDLFSMGIVLWECITGRRLFYAKDRATRLDMICNEPIAAPSTIDAQLAPLDFVFEKALAREPERRFQTAVAFMNAIENSAIRIGGLASRRSVANLVKTLAREKLDRDRRLIQNAAASRSIAPTAKTSSESMEGRISHIRIKSVSNDDPSQSQDSDIGLEAKKAETAHNAKIESFLKFFSAWKDGAIQPAKLKWLAGGIVGGIIIAITSIETLSLLSTPDPITAHPLEDAADARAPFNSANQDTNRMFFQWPTANHASSNTLGRKNRAPVNRRYTHDSSEKAKFGIGNASINQRFQLTREKTSSNPIGTHGKSDNPFVHSSEKEISPNRRSRPHLRTASLGDLPDNPFELPIKSKKLRPKKTRAKPHSTSTGNIPDNPFD